MTPASSVSQVEESPSAIEPGATDRFAGSTVATAEPPTQTDVAQAPRRFEPGTRPRVSSPGVPARPRPDLFYGSLLDYSSTRPRRATREFFASIFTHVLVLAFLTLIPFCITESIDLTQFTRTQLVAPPPPPPPPPPAPMARKVAQLPKRVLMTGGKLLAPTVIPQNVAMLHEKPLPPEIDMNAGGAAGGVPGGVPGGQMGGVLGSIITAGQHPLLPAITPPPAKPMAPVRVGGRVKEPQKIFAPSPEYPVLARQARVQGTVVIDAIIDTNGNVVDVKVVSGHPLLIQAALDAVKQWKFVPTYLNDQPVAVELIVNLQFRLS